MISFKIDANNIEAKLQELKENIEPSIRDRVLGIAGLAFLDSIVNEPPMPPVDTGFLQRSGVVFVGKKLVYFDDPENSGVSHAGKEGECMVALNAEYAAYQHELPAPYKTHRRPDANAAGEHEPDFVASKLPGFASEFQRIIAAETKKNL